MASRLLGRIVRIGGGKVLDAALGRLLPPVPKTPATKLSRPIMGGLLGGAAVKIATRSVPGAILIGGWMLAKARYEKQKAAQQPAPAADEPDVIGD